MILGSFYVNSVLLPFHVLFGVLLYLFLKLLQKYYDTKCLYQVRAVIHITSYLV
jgi:hypothetical protein